MNILDSDPQLVNPTPRLSAHDSPNTNGVCINQGTFNLVHGNVTVGHFDKQRCHHVREVESITAQKLITFKWNRYRWVDFDQQSLRQLRTSSRGIVTMGIVPMALSQSRVKVHHIYPYDRQDIFENPFVKSSCVLLLCRTIP